MAVAVDIMLRAFTAGTNAPPLFDRLTHVKIVLQFKL